MKNLNDKISKKQLQFRRSIEDENLYPAFYWHDIINCMRSLSPVRENFVKIRTCHVGIFLKNLGIGGLSQTFF